MHVYIVSRLSFRNGLRKMYHDCEESANKMATNYHRALCGRYCVRCMSNSGQRKADNVVDDDTIENQCNVFKKNHTLLCLILMI